MATNSGDNYSESMSSEETNVGGASSHEPDTVNEVHNLPFDKLYDAIKMLSRSLYKMRNKYFNLKKTKIHLKDQLSNSCSKEELKNIKDENVKVREQIEK